jgi:hypothetical protein
MPLSTFNVACSAVCLLNFRVEAKLFEPYIEMLLNQQAANGGWAAWGAYAGFNHHHDGSPALTTALAIEALAKYARVEH